MFVLSTSMRQIESGKSPWIFKRDLITHDIRIPHEISSVLLIEANVATLLRTQDHSSCTVLSIFWGRLCDGVLCTLSILFHWSHWHCIAHDIIIVLTIVIINLLLFTHWVFIIMVSVMSNSSIFSKISSTFHNILPDHNIAINYQVWAFRIKNSIFPSSIVLRTGSSPLRWRCLIFFLIYLVTTWIFFSVCCNSNYYFPFTIHYYNANKIAVTLYLLFFISFISASVTAIFIT